MSNATQHSRESGDRRRRRSRGGKNRNRSQENRDSHDHNRNQRNHRSEEFRPQGPRPSRHAPPVKPLSWWQKLLAAIGLHKAPAAPVRPERKPEPVNIPKQENRPAKSNTRNARTNEGAERSGDSPKRRERGERGESRSRGGDGSTVESNRVYVGNLSYDVTEQDLQELFKGIGGVRGVEIVYNRSTHRSKGYGFVEMLHKDEAVRSVEVLHDQHFMGRRLIVSGAKSKGQDEREDREESPGRESRPVVVAPVPAAAMAAAVETTEPLIPTIVESVAEVTAEPSAEGETKAENA